ncbi:hypothetical protein GCM10023115_50300 [Pontixanthobacter gangjinensis]|uniref:Uncharacterized protein n=1 Tax=Christiangramia aestuarii TaxID=1028746 RepID=A0A7K1LP88_9FLAO|nr:hypothetical protein [Christiangramia aestuarii]MUP42612.1 hypothetical protein [Christiangramia aestuarii]
MELGKIEKLLERYDEGETSLAEEKILREYFLREEVPEHLKSYQMMFMFSTRQADEKLEEEPNISKSRKDWYSWTAIAAILVVALGIFFFNQPERMNHNDLGTISDEQQAYEKTKETLNMISQIMNEGKSDLVYLKEFNNTKDKIIQID